MVRAVLTKEIAMHVIFGAGPVGSGTAQRLAAAGQEVRIVTRSGSGPEAVERIAADAADRDAVAKVTVGADVIYNCVNPPRYDTWVKDWPPVAANLLAAAEDAGAVLVIMDNLYGYGPVDHPMREDDPLASTETKGRVRAAMWADALAAHRAGRVRVTEARASDFFGPGLTDTSHLGAMVVPRVLAGKTVRVQGRPDQPHTWTYIDDVSRLLAVLGTDERAWGRAWHVPSGPPLSQRQAVAALADAGGVAAPKVTGSPRWLFRAGGLFNGQLKELAGVHYQWDRPFVMDSSAATETFGIEPTAQDEAMAATVAWWREKR
jgi:nucleoside-diphosphate-sugar epimerase